MTAPSASRLRPRHRWRYVLTAISGLLLISLDVLSAWHCRPSEPVQSWPIAGFSSPLATSPRAPLVAMDTTFHGLVDSPTRAATKTVELRAIPDGTLVRTFPAGNVSALAFSPDGQVLAIGGGDGIVQLWQVTAGRRLRAFPPQRSSIHQLAFSPTGAALLIDQTVWDLATGHLRFTLPLQSEPIAFNPDGQTLADTERAGIVIRRVEDGSRIRTLAVHGGIDSFSPDGQIMVVIQPANDAQVRWLRSQDGQVVRTLPVDRSRIYTSSWSPDGAWFGLAEGSSYGGGGIMEFHTFDWLIPPGWITIRRGSDGQVVQRLQGHTIRTDNIVFSADGAWVISSGEDQRVKLWQVAPQDPRWGHMLQGVRLLLALWGLWLGWLVWPVIWRIVRAGMVWCWSGG